MDAVQNVTSGAVAGTRTKKYVETEYGIFEDIKDEIKKVEGQVDTTNWKTVPWYDREQMKRELQPNMLEMKAAAKGTSSATAAAALKDTSAVMADAKAAIGKFYDGSLSADELQSEYERLSERYVAAYRENGYPVKLVSGSIQVQLGAQEVFYDEFRRAVLEVAVSRNNAEGKQYITGKMASNRTVKYYNSDYYYKSEAAIEAITKGAYAVAEKSKEQCRALGYDKYEFSVPDYKADRLNLYYNFNSAWSNNFLGGNQFISDYDQIPPKDFQWFYETGGDGRNVCLKLCDSYTDGGEKNAKTDEFDPTDVNSASMWARFRDSSGVERLLTAVFNYADAGKKLFRVSELLSASGAPSEVNQFLNALQVFKYGYNPDFKSSGLNMRA